MPTTEIKQLFEESRFPNGWKFLAIIIYSPIGIVLAVLRLFIALQAIAAAALLPSLSVVRMFVLRCLCLVLGIVVRKESERDETVRVIVANHIAPCDHLPVHLLTQCITPSLWELPPGILSSALGLKDLGMRQGRDALISQVCSHIEKEVEPVLVFPEGEMTSGKFGLLKFATWPFCLHSTIQPVAVTAWRLPIAEVALTRFSSRPWADLFWFLFVPFTLFTVKFMPSMKRGENETEQEFTNRVEVTIANQLHLQTTKHTANDKAELLKRLSLERNHPPVLQTAGSGSTTGMMNSELQRMAAQVGEVLPAVPRDTIVKDLLKTRSVDVTISNILEGLVLYVPKTVPEPTTSSTHAAASTSSHQLPNQSTPDTYLDTSAKSFARSAQERTLSFQERKARLIEHARNKYIEKHKLKVAGYNC